MSRRVASYPARNRSLRACVRNVSQRYRTLFVYKLSSRSAMVCHVLFPMRGMEYPRCSTALDGSLNDISLDDDVLRFTNSDEDCENNGTIANVNNNDRQSIRKHSAPLLKLKEVIESLRLDSATPHESDSDYTSLTASSDASLRFDSDTNTRRSDLVGLEGSVEDLNSETDPETGIDSNDNNNSAQCEPESDIIEQFRQFGVRFIRDPGRYSRCKCRIPRELLQYHDNLSEVACEVDPRALPLCFQMRWAEFRQDFEIDVFGDIQFQDFLIGRQERGPYHAMIHFDNVFANIGYDGTYWYWTLVGNASTPFIEDKLRNKDNFVSSLRTMVRHHMSARKGKAVVLCPRILPNAHLFVRSQYDEQCRPTIEADDDDSALGKDRSVDDLTLKGPRSLSYLQLFSESYYAALATF